MTLGITEILIGAGALLGAWTLYQSRQVAPATPSKPSGHDPIACSRYLIGQMKKDPDTKEAADQVAAILGPIILKLDGQ